MKLQVQFEGSGWAALLQSPTGDLQIVQIENHNKLFLLEYKILLVLDVWEHAYYIDYENSRDDYINEWWHVVNWEILNNRIKE